jgi:histone deacetylase complex regulatory component SIN3
MVDLWEAAETLQSGPDSSLERILKSDADMRSDDETENRSRKRRKQSHRQIHEFKYVGLAENFDSTIPPGETSGATAALEFNDAFAYVQLVKKSCEEVDRLSLYRDFLGLLELYRSGTDVREIFRQTLRLFFTLPSVMGERLTAGFQKFAPAGYSIDFHTRSIVTPHGIITIFDEESYYEDGTDMLV